MSRFSLFFFLNSHVNFSIKLCLFIIFLACIFSSERIFICSKGNDHHLSTPFNVDRRAMKRRESLQKNMDQLSFFVLIRISTYHRDIVKNVWSLPGGTLIDIDELLFDIQINPKNMRFLWSIAKTIQWYFKNRFNFNLFLYWTFSIDICFEKCVDYYFRSVFYSSKLTKKL